MTETVDVAQKDKIGACLPHECNVVRESMRLAGYETEFFPDADGWVYWHAKYQPKALGRLLNEATRSLQLASSDSQRVGTPEVLPSDAS